ncbi:bifunctional GTP diphosphokinase/guanosine-3',5'-bis pyrophosphate 3'-pyrophosphohydrolase [Aquicella lusitana]|uniref:guanosine-3',5'-bis(diphosphate) 3'-diphosphatase n=1 Tax=Aquicella lusitana TaxID=254246 RepID=A0A370GH43_9COXI|nr:bifunctional GTP diphosphokinase/guanosine-3',5'-bis pyrophosphate 3'-pyrophosphohydrolase [Aquicella lusitana]RDI41704.1 guanosine-3',5'-bis(diphosphate) 3'-pyrophosphohydrolase [Aquicella lusitana]
MGEFETLRDELNQYISHTQVADIEKAYLFAKEAHGSQSRYTGEPYITHPVAVAQILAQMRMDPPTIMAAILHDVVEDTPVTQAELIEKFGNEVAELVDGVTKLTQIHFENYAQAQAENFRKMVMAMASDIRVILVKLADRLHNMRTLYGLPPDKRRRISQETLEIFAPIANRLGMHTFRVELEDLGFASLYPMRYRVLKEAVAKALGNRREIMDMINKQIQESIKKGHIPSATLSGREKHLYSIYKKMHERHLSFSEIMDVYGFRIIVDKVDTCYRVLGVLHNLYKPIAQRFKDYIAIPKANGYQSLHTTLFGPYGVPIEVQIRTEEMHKMAENGIAAHWLYKTEKKVFHDAQSRAREWLKGILEMDKSSRNSLEFIENVKIDLFPDEVYVFTPKGQIIELPAGATPVDFAYAIHSDIGNTCVAVRLDKRLSPLSTPLVSGQQVEVITAPGARPNAAWLNFVVTGKARSKIKHYLKKQQREESIELGRRLVEKALQLYGIPLDQVSEPALQTIVIASKLESIAHLFEEVGIGNRPALLVAKQVVKFIGETVRKEGTAEKGSREAVEDKAVIQPLIIKGTEGLVINFARCCRPIPGDQIAGLIKVGLGIEVHMMHCPNIEKYHHVPEKYVPLIWQEGIEGDFSVDLKVDLVNRRGSLASLTLAISEGESNIEHIRAEESDRHHFHVDVTISVRNRSHLARILRKIRKRKDVIRVLRHKPHVETVM